MKWGVFILASMYAGCSVASYATSQIKSGNQYEENSRACVGTAPPIIDFIASGASLAAGIAIFATKRNRGDSIGGSIFSALGPGVLLAGSFGASGVFGVKKKCPKQYGAPTPTIREPQEDTEDDATDDSDEDFDF